MALYFYLEGRNLDIVQSGIVMKHYRSLCASSFPDLEASTIRQSYVDLDVANKCLPDDKRHSDAELGDAMLTILLSTSEDIYRQVEQKKDTRLTLDGTFVATGMWVKDTLVALLLDRASRELLANPGTTGSAKQAKPTIRSTTSGPSTLSAATSSSASASRTCASPCHT